MQTVPEAVFQAYAGSLSANDDGALAAAGKLLVRCRHVRDRFSVIRGRAMRGQSCTSALNVRLTLTARAQGIAYREFDLGLLLAIIGRCGRAVSVEQASSWRPFGVRIRFDAAFLQADGSVGEDREMVDVAVVDVGDHDLSFQYCDEKIWITYHLATYALCDTFALRFEIDA